MSDPADDARVIDLLKRKDISPLGYIFAQASVLDTVQAEYCQLIDESFPNALDFLPFVQVVTGVVTYPEQIQLNEQTLATMKASELIKLAYPIAKYDEQDNRQQQILDTVNIFSKQIDENNFPKNAAKGHLILLQQAIEVFAALNSLFESQAKLRVSLQQGLTEAEICATFLQSPVGEKYGTYDQCCDKLKHALEEQFKTVQHIKVFAALGSIYEAQKKLDSLKQGLDKEGVSVGLQESSKPVLQEGSWHMRLFHWLDDTINKISTIIIELKNLLSKDRA